MALPEFKYSPINLDRPSIRLVRLQGGHDTDIECDLFEAWLDEVERDGLEYEALSYTWGSTERVVEIRINKSRMLITVNLYVALLNLRQGNVARILWIDAICIDQDNIQERGHQVQHMGEIYKTAERVVVWLGVPTAESDLVIDFMKTLPTHVAFAAGDSASEQDEQIFFDSYTEETQIRYRKAFEALLLRPWWRRVWILQEIANAKRASIVCGRKVVSTRIFTTMPTLLGYEPDLHSQAVLDVMPGHLRNSTWWSEERTLRTLVYKFHGSEASDQRDLIYALLGMSSDVHERQQLRADYGKTLKAIIADATTFLLFGSKPSAFPPPVIDWDWPAFVYNVQDLCSPTFAYALKEKNLDAIAQLLLRDDHDVNWKDQDGRTPLWWAAKEGLGEVVRQLLQKDDIDVHPEEKDGMTPLRIALKNEHAEVIKILSERINVEQGQFHHSEDTAVQTVLALARDVIISRIYTADGYQGVLAAGKFLEKGISFHRFGMRLNEALRTLSTS